MTAVPPAYYVGLSAILFTIGVIGVLVRRNPLVIFMSIELMLNAANLAFVAFGRAHGGTDGQIIVFFVMTVAAAEVAVGLAIIVAIFRARNRINVDDLGVDALVSAAGTGRRDSGNDEIRGSDVARGDAALGRALLEQMLLIRRFEEKAAEMYALGKIGGFLHLYIGQEAVAVGAMSTLRPDDYAITDYREHGHALAKGADPRRVMAELFGRRDGLSKGKGGSMHMFDRSVNFLGGYAIVGGTCRSRPASASPSGTRSATGSSSASSATARCTRARSTSR